MHMGMAGPHSSSSANTRHRWTVAWFIILAMVVVAGRPDRQMPPWDGVLDGEQISQIGAYLETLAVEGANWEDF